MVSGGARIPAVAEDCKNGDLPLYALTRQKALFDVFPRLPEAIVLLDTDDRVLRVKSEFTRIFGYPQEEACECLINELLLPEELLAEGEECALCGLQFFSRSPCAREESGRTLGLAGIRERAITIGAKLKL